jgi:MoxR-like ATPase
VQWHDFGTGVPITLGKNIPLIAKTLTDLGADDVGHVLGTTLVSLVAAGQFESIAAAVSAVVETTTLDVEVIQDTTHDELVGDGSGQSNGGDNGPDEPDRNGVPFDEVDLLEPQFDRDPADVELTELYFEDETELLGEAIAALRDGNHLLFVGPPGTGKSDLARVLSEELVGENYELTTATADWSTFDTIGGYRQQEDGDLQFSPGVFLSRFQDEKDRPVNEWLIVDEFNRANIDKAFGSLFSVLTGDDVLLPFSEDGDDIRMYGSEPDPESIVTSTDYVVPDDWRLLATMNTFDKSSLYDLSYALSRRFSYIHVPAPTVDDIDESLVKAYIECWDRVDPDVDRIKAVTELWKAVQTERPLGPAIIRDVLVAANSDLTRGVVQHVLPQFEGLMNRTQSELLEGILETGHVDDDRIETFGQQYFGLTDWTA